MNPMVITKVQLLGSLTQLHNSIWVTYQANIRYFSYKIKKSQFLSQAMKDEERLRCKAFE